MWRLLTCCLLAAAAASGCSGAAEGLATLGDACDEAMRAAMAGGPASATFPEGFQEPGLACSNSVGETERKGPVTERVNQSGVAWMLFPAADEGLPINDCAYRLLPVPFSVDDPDSGSPDVDVTLVGSPDLYVRNVGPVDRAGHVSAEAAKGPATEGCGGLEWKQAVLRLSRGRDGEAPIVELFEPRDFERLARFGEAPDPTSSESAGGFRGS